MIKAVALDSSAISFVAYDRRMHTLDVQFREGECYRYFQVPEAIYEGLLTAESAGGFWNGVKHRYAYEKARPLAE